MWRSRVRAKERQVRLVRAAFSQLIEPHTVPPPSRSPRCGNEQCSDGCDNFVQICHSAIEDVLFREGYAIDRMMNFLVSVGLVLLKWHTDHHPESLETGTESAML